MPSLRHLTSCLALAFTASASHAHITLENRSAEAGSNYKAILKVGHGCEGSAIREIRVYLPDGVVGAKPMPKAGWNLEIQRQALPQAYESHGKTIADAPKMIRWSGGTLPDTHYDEFVLVAKLPEQPGRLYWRVTQICDQGQIDWAVIPAAGKRPGDYPAPAATLDVLPKPGANSEHKH